MKTYVVYIKTPVTIYNKNDSYMTNEPFVVHDPRYK